MGGFSGVLPLRSVRTRGLSAAVTLALVALFLGQGAAAQGMALPYENSVTKTGSARYSIPIAIAPGTAGIAPPLALTYDSQAGNGLLGMGWQLEGLPSIGRCPRTVATDGVHGGVAFDANDRFCLDGQRLMAISGAYGAEGTEYRTEIESFTKVISHGTAGTGPAWFEARSKSGQRMEFGNSADSRIIQQSTATARAWAVNKVADTKGNYFTVSYANSSSQTYPTRIDYTGNAAAGLVPYNSVRFVYQTRPDDVPAFLGGASMRVTVRLSNLQIFAEESLVSDYRLSYAQGTSTRRSQLTSVMLCGAGNACLPATSFAWQQGNENANGLSFSQYNPPPNLSAGFISGDWNGDGLTDLAANTAWPTKWFINNGASFTRYDVALGREGNGNSAFVVGDWNRDGLSDLLRRTDMAIQFYISNGLVNGAPNFTAYSSSIVVNPRYRSAFYSGDWNGDGLTDLMELGVDPEGNNGPPIWYMNNGLVNGAISFTKQEDTGDPHFLEPVAAFCDLNGDGVSDALLKGPGNGRSYLAIGNGLVNGVPSFTAYGTPIAFESLNKFFLGDWNGDGLTDLMNDDEGIWYINNGFASGAISFIQYGAVLPISWSGSLLAVGDWNGDGLSDVLHSDGFGKNNGTQPDLITKFRSSFGATTAIIYKPLSAAGLYVKDSGANAAVAPTLDLAASHWVVSHVDQSDGIGGQRGWDYSYAGAKVDQQGRGFLGFRQRTVKDLRTGIASTSTHRQDFPFAGLTSNETSTLGPLTLSAITNAYGAANLGGTRRRAFLSGSVATRTDLDGTAFPSVTTSYQYDAFGNATEVTAATSDGFSRTTANSYSNDEINWLLGRLTRATAVNQAP